MKIGIVIPWRPQPHRMQAFEFTYSWYQTNFPDAKIYLTDKPGKLWSMSGSRNLGVKMAEADECDVVIISDADTIPDLTSLKETMEVAMNDRLIHNPYTQSLYFDQESSEKFINGESIENLKYQEHESNGGIYVCQPISWWTIGGADEKFLGWGFEDSAMNHVHSILHGVGIVKHPGKIYSFYHERDETPEKPTQNTYNNFYLFRRYVDLKTPPEILQLVKAEKWN